MNGQRSGERTHGTARSRSRRRGGLVRLLAAGLVAGSGVVLVPVLGEVAHAASFVGTPPTRLYMAPEGTTLLAGLVGVPIGTLTFDGGQDVISQDLRNIDIDAEVGPVGCDTVTDQPVGVVDFDIDDCPRLQFDVLHGRVKLPNATKVERDYLSDPDGPGPLAAGSPNPNDFVWRLAGGAIISQIGGGGDPDTPNDPAGHLGYHLSGTAAQINAAMDTLTFTPDDGYYYTNSPPEARLSMLLVSGDPNGVSDSHTVEIRVLDVNDAASLDGPASKSAQPEIELKIPPVDPPASYPYTGSEWTVADEDNDEIVDTDTGDPGELPDGAGDKMLLVGYLDCGVPTVDEQTGFHFRGGTFQADQPDIEDLLTDFYDLTTAPTEVQTAIDGLMAAIDAIAPGLLTVPLATTDPFIYNDVFAGIGDIDDVSYALSQVFFLSNAENDTCTLYTVVSDLGNNGLPLQYIGDPPSGVEVPFLGVPPIDIVQTTITVGSLQTVDASFVPGSIFVGEPGTATATIDIEPDTHPAFDLRWSTQDGTATVADADYQSMTAATITVPDNAATVTIDANAFGDAGPPEGNENFTLVLTTPTDPPPGAFVRPFGWEVTSSAPIQNVIIVDSSSDPSVSVSNASVVEGDSGTANLVFTLTLDGPASGDESVDVSTSNGTASQPGDYTAVNDTVTFALGETQQTVIVAVQGDTDDENDETVLLGLTNPVGMTVGDGPGVGTIVDDDGPEPQVSVNNVTLAEGDAGTTAFTFTLSLDSPAVGGESVDVATANGTASAPGDYAAVTQTVTFANGEMSRTVSVQVSGDTAPEPDETFFVNLTDPVGLVPVDAQGQGTIQNDDTAASVSVNDVTLAEGDAGTTAFTFTLSLDSPAIGGESVDVATANGTASEPGDYAAVTQTVTFANGETSRTVTVQVSGDTAPEPNETFFVNLTNADGLTVLDAQGIGTILDDDPAGPTLSIADASVVEGTGAGTTTIDLVMTTSALQQVVCGYRVVLSHGSTSDADFTSTAFFDVTAVWDTDDQGIPRSFGITRDVFDEADETFTVTITGNGATPCAIGDGVATGTVLDDDLPLPTLSIADASVVEGTGAGATTIDLVMTTSALYPVECGYRVVLSHGSTSDADFTSTAFFDVTAVWDTDDQGIPRSFGITRDASDELNESFTLTVSPNAAHPVPCVIADGIATGTIIDDDGAPPDAIAPSVTIDQALGQVDPTSASPITFTVVFSEAVVGFDGGAVDLSASTAPGTLVASVSGAGPTYTVSVEGMTGPGLVVASIDAAAVTDAAGNANAASTSTDNTVLFDAQPPSVTIDQAAGQIDPTSASPITFTAVFSEAVVGFDGGAVDLSASTAPGTLVASVSGAGPTYTVSVEGMTGPGLVVASIGAVAVTDAAGNANAASTSTDNSVQFVVVPGPLTLNLPPNQTANNDPGQAGAIVSYPTVTATGGVQPVFVDCAPISGSFFPLGATTVSCTATDSEGLNQDTIVFGTFTVTVVDNEAPLIADNPDLTRETVANAPVVVTFNLPAASDNSGVAPAVLCAPASGSTFGVGTSTVTCTATDGAGNSASSSFTVTVTSTGSGVPGPTTPPVTTAPTTNPIAGLPATGSDPQVLVLLALLLLAGGTVLARSARRRIS
jgi:Calx-beta domain/HYR domain